VGARPVPELLEVEVVVGVDVVGPRLEEMLEGAVLLMGALLVVDDDDVDTGCGAVSPARLDVEASLELR